MLLCEQVDECCLKARDFDSLCGATTGLIRTLFLHLITLKWKKDVDIRSSIGCKRFPALPVQPATLVNGTVQHTAPCICVSQDIHTQWTENCSPLVLGSEAENSQPGFSSPSTVLFVYPQVIITASRWSAHWRFAPSNVLLSPPPGCSPMPTPGPKIRYVCVCVFVLDDTF